jgi:hypothetical protein
VHSVTLQRRSGPITLVRPEGTTAALTMAHQPERAISLPRRTLRECLSEELRRLDADEVYAEVLTKGLPLVNATTPGRTKAAPKKAPAKASGPAGTARTRKAPIATPADTPSQAPARATRRPRRTAPTAGDAAAQGAGTAAARS